MAITAKQSTLIGFFFKPCVTASPRGGNVEFFGFRVTVMEM
jgi:hypothetical protein